MKPHSFDLTVHDFLREASQYRLGELLTESQHPLTKNLSHLAKNDLRQAISLLQTVELKALESLDSKIDEIEILGNEIEDVFRSGGRVFLCGCGATGRLSLSLETLWRELTENSNPSTLPERVRSMIAGGDYALVRSIEKFEDFPEYGERQLKDLGFTANDLLISTTEGGETPFVIGATEAAARISVRKPFFLFCNPPDLLAATAERSRLVLENPRIRSISLITGPMAIAGSTRLQASTVLMLAVGSALFSCLPGQSPVRSQIKDFADLLAATDFSPLMEPIELESGIYLQGQLCQHETARYGITVLTDTTERSPTFSLLPFENAFDDNKHLSWTYLSVPGTSCARTSWQKILKRSPRALTWEGFREFYGEQRVHGFDFSPQSLQRRRSASSDGDVHVFQIDAEKGEITFRLKGVELKLKQPRSLLSEHLLLKCALNFSSNLVMGRMNRFEGNLMLYVRPTNKKLIDRSIRFISIMLREASIEGVSYERICQALFETIGELPPDQPVVIKTYEKLARIAKI